MSRLIYMAVCALCLFLMVSFSAYIDHIHVFYYISLILGITKQFSQRATYIAHYPAGICRRIDVSVTSLHRIDGDTTLLCCFVSAG